MNTTVLYSSITLTLANKTWLNSRQKLRTEEGYG